MVTSMHAQEESFIRQVLDLLSRLDKDNDGRVDYKELQEQSRKEPLLIDCLERIYYVSHPELAVVSKPALV